MRTLKTVPRINSLRHAYRLLHNPVSLVMENISKYGPDYYFHIGGKTKGLLVTSPDLLQHVLQKNNKNYQKSPFQADELAHYIGKGLLTSNGAHWLRQRRLIQPAFGKAKIDALAVLIRRETKNVLNELEASGLGKVSAHQLAMNLTFRIITSAICSNEMTEAELLKLREAVDKVQRMLIFQIRQPYKRWYYKLMGHIRKHELLAAEAKGIIRHVVERRKQSGEQKDDMLAYLLDCRYQDTGQPMKTSQLIDELIILLVAGHETTALALTWTLGLLRRHSHIYQHLMSLKNNREAFNGYLQKITQESLRMYPPAWVMDRIVLEDDEVDGLEIKKGTFILNFIYGAHYDHRHWECPQDFNPNRWNDDFKPASFTYLPFGAGPRMCIGKYFSLLELGICLEEILTRYEIQLNDEKLPEVKPLITLHPKDELFIDIKKIHT